MKLTSSANSFQSACAMHITIGRRKIFSTISSTSCVGGKSRNLHDWIDVDFFSWLRWELTQALPWFLAFTTFFAGTSAGNSHFRLFAKGLNISKGTWLNLFQVCATSSRWQKQLHASKKLTCSTLAFGPLLRTSSSVIIVFMSLCNLHLPLSIALWYLSHKWGFVYVHWHIPEIIWTLAQSARRDVSALPFTWTPDATSDGSTKPLRLLSQLGSLKTCMAI